MEEIRFFVNGQEHVVTNDVHPATRLSDYLRQVARLKGTKVMCREGSCGACVVTVEYNDPVTEKRRTRAINSCLCPIELARGWHITTTEGLGSKRDGFHPIQQTMADHSATQCGFCTPGFVMSAYGLLKDKPDASSDELEKSLDGNLCRCTGYRPIVDAMRSLTKDGGGKAVDIEDLLKLRCLKKTTVFKKPGPAPVERPRFHSVWQRPRSLDQLLDLLHTNMHKKIRLVFGNTATGVYKWDRYDLYYDIRDIPELYEVTEGNGCLEIGANLSLTDLQEVFTKYASKSGFEYLSNLVDYIELIANKPIRNAGGWAGNLMIQHDHPNFPSDLYTPFAALGATITLADKSGNKQLTVDALLDEDMNGKVIVSIKLPALTKQPVFAVYKVMPRNKSAHSYVNAAFKLTHSDTSEKTIVQAAVVYNGLGAGNHHQKDLEKYLIDKSLLDSKIIPGVLKTLTQSVEVADSEPLVSVDYRKTLARNLLFKFLCQHIPNGPVVPPVTLSRPPSSGKQEFSTKPDEYPITQPLTKLSATIQASGETQYTDDLPRLEGELSAVLVLSTIALGEIDTIDTSLALTAGGAVDVVTAADIPGNNKMDVIQVLADKMIEHHGQPIAVVLADDVGAAYKAASLVKVTYKNIQEPVIDMDDAIQKGSIHQEFPHRIIGEPEDAFKSCSRVVEGKFAHGAQYHFYIENQACLVLPREGGYDVWSSSQWPDQVQSNVASVLNVSANSVHVTLPRIGGAFGGKVFYGNLVSDLCALGAHKTNRPVRLALGLDTCMKMTGHRPAVRATYKIGLDENNTLKAVNLKVYWNCGHRMTGYMPGNVSNLNCHLDGLYYVPNWSVQIVAVKTNLPMTTAMRSPSQVPAHLIIEQMLEHVVAEIGESAVSFKQRHLYKQGQMMLCLAPMPDNTIHDLWQAAISTSEFHKRQEGILQFNKKNRWVKRGLAITPSKFTVTYVPFFSYAVYAAVYHHDGTISVTHGGCEMGQGLHTKVIQVVGKTLGVSMDLVKVFPTNTLTSPNSFVTGGSQTSEYLCRTVYEICKILIGKLAPFKEKHPDADWKTLVGKAYDAGVNMAVTHRHIETERNTLDYLVPGVCVAEAEVDVLTGQNQILRADMHMDIGQSVNPEIDVGQIEGALIMGLGLMSSESDVNDNRTGQLITSTTWDYKPPTVGDIPADMRIYLMKDKPNKLGVYSSKCIGEPPICATPVFLHAVKTAIAASRQERGKTNYFDIYAPATPEVIVKACDVSLSDLA